MRKQEEPRTPKTPSREEDDPFREEAGTPMRLTKDTKSRLQMMEKNLQEVRDFMLTLEQQKKVIAALEADINSVLAEVSVDYAPDKASQEPFHARSSDILTK